MIDGIADIERRCLEDHLDILRAQITLVARGGAGPQLPGANSLARRHESSSGDPGVSFDDSAIHDARLHADEAFILQRARMDEREMTHRYVRSYHRTLWSFSRDVDHGAILDVGSRANPNGRDVTAHHGAVPNARAFANLYIPDQNGSGRNEGARCKRRRSITEPN